MGRIPFPHLLALLCGFALAVAGCGRDGSNLIPRQRAQELVSQLDALEARIAGGRNCDGLDTALATFRTDAAALPNSVDRRLRSRINQGAASLKAHAQSTCQDTADANAARAAQETPTDSTPPDTTTTDTTTTQTDTTGTDTTTTGTDTTPTTPTPSTGTPPDTGGGTPGPSDATPPDTGDNGGIGDGTTP